MYVQIDDEIYVCMLFAEREYSMYVDVRPDICCVCCICSDILWQWTTIGPAKSAM